MISIENLKFSYPKSRFDLKIDHLNIAASRATAIVGPSGSGKTTLLHLIAGILQPDQGSIQVGDYVLSQMPDAVRRQNRLTGIGLVFQDFELIDYLSVVDNVLLPCRIGSATESAVALRPRALSLLDQVGLKEHARKSVTHLSQGERQRVAICRALLTKPKTILADEPTGNLDPVASGQILDLLLQTVKNDHTTLVMVTHDHSLLSRFDESVDFNQFLTRSASEGHAPTPT